MFVHIDIYIFENIRAQIFEYLYSVHLSITNIFVFGPTYDPKYIRIRNRVKKSNKNIFVFVFGKKTIFATLC